MNLIKTLCIISLVVMSCSNKKSEKIEIQKKPNVILVITDDQGYGDIGAHGNKVIKTPNIDDFYKESYHLTDFHVNPTCAPTRSGLMTGRFANSTGVWHTVGGRSLLREDEKTMADMFTENGYKTAAFGKWHMGDNYPFRAHDRGFQETVMHYGGGVQQTPDYWNNDYFDDTYFKNGVPQKYEGYCTDVFFSEAISFIERNKEAPFFCYISTNAPHGPYNVPPEYYEMYKSLSNDILKDTQKRFYGMITNVDDNFGKLRAKLKALNIADNTILIFMTDNGTSSGYYNKKGEITGFNAGMRGTKGSEYEGGHRVPFFIHWKDGNISEAKDISRLTAQIDILPTLAELCDLKLPKDHLYIDGKSLVPTFNGSESVKDDRMLVTDSQRLEVPKKWRKSSIMQDKWRLINGKELYNIEDDKGQINDISPQFPEKVKEMRDFYEQWWAHISGKFNEQIHFKIGLDNENPVTLTAHDVHSVKEDYPWNQIQIRDGKVGSGYWAINVTEEADYKISLRRYPKESGLLINTSIPKVTTQDVPGLQFDIPEGKNLEFTNATIKIGDAINESVKISPKDISAEFKVHLNAGETSFSGSFFDAEGNENVAYYAYIEKL